MFRIKAFARSTIEVSSEARYINVVVSDECPIPSRITLIGIPLDCAADAQLCLAQYMVSFVFIPASLAISFNRMFIL